MDGGRREKHGLSIIDAFPLIKLQSFCCKLIRYRCARNNSSASTSESGFNTTPVVINGNEDVNGNALKRFLIYSKKKRDIRSPPIEEVPLDSAYDQEKVKRIRLLGVTSSKGTSCTSGFGCRRVK
ncbi:hypothetical protein RUM43_008683 [Polyplax serrata]|uniref:Uncharacterized protein n=1 Tax=Polyplax serrata TaxID=468196 RepID=A0AAN8NN16_POLSC